MKKVSLVIIGVIISFLGMGMLSAQNYVPFGIRYQETLKGEMLLVGNSILNVNDASYGHTNPNLPYTGSHGHNAYINLGYIDIDGDGSTKNSSSANVTYTNSACLKVRKAYLYWSSTYTLERINNQPMNRALFGQVKFKTPSASVYTDLTGTRIYDGNDEISGASNANTNQRAYVYMADVTSLLENEETLSGSGFSGTYTVANVEAPIGREPTGVGHAAGWSLYIVYEDNTLQSKHITLFDGFSAINSTNSSLDIPVSGFQTIPTGPVKAKFAFTSLEGELGIGGDMLRINSTLIDTPGRTSTGSRPNFFNSKITNSNITTPPVGEYLDRNPASTNLLGFDAGILALNNPGNSLIANNATSATITPSNRSTSSGQDAFYPYMMAFNVEVIEPKIILEKKVLNASGVDVTGGDVYMGNQLQYQIKFKNIGNDNATNLVIKDLLPVNVFFTDVAANVSLPPGVTYTYVPYDASNPNNSHYIEFAIPNSMVEVGDAEQTISFYIRVAPECFDFRDACSNEVKNIAYVSYLGDDNKTTIPFTGESYNSFTNCDGGITGPSNFIVDMQGCVATSTATLCGSEVEIAAGSGFVAYRWTKTDAPDPTAVIGTTQTITVTQVGTYRVVKTGPPGCVDMVEEIEVILHANAINYRPFDQFDDEVLICTNDGRDYPQIYLCGTNATENLVLNLTGVTSQVWQKRNESSCTVPSNYPKNCPVYDENCTWDTVSTANNYEVSDAGDYRLEVTFQNGCTTIYYFKVTKAELDPRVTVRDIICNTPGQIMVTNVSIGYEYALQNSSGVIVQPYQSSNTFTVTTPDNYTVLIKQNLAVTDPDYTPCVFEVSAPIRLRNPQLMINTTPLACEASKGTIRVQVTDAIGPYDFTITGSAGTVAEVTATTTTDITFDGLNAGIYTVMVTTPDGCNLNETVEVERIEPMQLSINVTKPLLCDDAAIRVDVTGGTPGTSYAYSIDGGATYFYNYTGSYYEFTGLTEARVYTVTVVDANNCRAEISTDLRANPVPTFNIETDLQNCATTASLTFTNTTNTSGYTIRYSIDEGSTSQTSPIFNNLTPGNTYTPTLIYSLGTASCTVTDTVTIGLGNGAITAAFAGVAELVGCGTGADEDKALVRVTNVQGGTPPYEYSFDNKQNWVTTSYAYMAPGVNLPVYVRDSENCEYEMFVTVEDAPQDPVFTNEVTYNCDGTGNIQLNNDQANFDYVYSLDGGTTTQTSSLFENLSPGTYNITISYGSNYVPTPNVLFLENFGAGANTSNSYINRVYYYEPQNGSNIVYNGNGVARATGNSQQLQDGEYTVSNRLNPNNGAWQIPNDHSGLTNGRMLFVNIGNILGTAGAILYQREMVDIIPGRDIQFSIAAMNLLKGNDRYPNGAPDLTIELYVNQAAINAGTPLVSQHLNPRVPGSNNPNDWHVYSYSLNPGANTTLIAVVRSNSLVTNGNDLALDDIYLYQIPRVCPFEQTISVTVQDDRAFAVVESTEVITNNTCSGASEGSYSISLSNFDTTTGYYYSTDAGATWTATTANPFVWDNLADGTYSVIFRYGQDTTNCEFTRNFTITSPNPITFTSLISDQVIRCDENSVAVTVNATGGTGALTYTLIQPDGTSIIQPSVSQFTGLTQTGTYTVTVSDANGCTVSGTDTFEVSNAPEPTIALDTNNSQVCYSTSSPASIAVTVTNGTAPFRYYINGNLRATTSSTTYQFTNLTPNTYNISVIDSYNCEATLSQVINDGIDVSNAVIAKQITCDTAPNDEGQIVVTITGGYPPYTYEVNGAAAVAITGNTFTYTTNVANTYNFVITDAQSCTTSVSRTLTAPITPNFATTQQNVSCYGDNTGSIEVTVTAGVAPYTYFVNGVDRGNQNVYNNLVAGTYTITVVDAYNCESDPQAVVITQPDTTLTGTLTIEELISCRADNRAKVTVTNVSGGTPFTNVSGDYYQYRYNGGSWTTTTTTYLPQGTHQVIVRDANDCELPLSITVAGPPTPPIVAVPTIDYFCDGTASLTVVTSSTVSFTYEYSIDGGTLTSSSTFTNVTPGAHTILVKYYQVGTATDCGYEISTNVIVDDRPFEVDTPIVTSLISCNGSADGAVTVAVSNFDAAGYRYSLNGGTWTDSTVSNLLIGNLSAGVHTITFAYKNADGTYDCTQTQTVTLSEPNPVGVTAVISEEAKCSNGELAQITVTATGGTPRYTYVLTEAGGAVRTQTANIFTGVVTGTYNVTVIDQNGCRTTTTTALVVEQPETIAFTLTPTICYSGNNDGEIQVTITNGNGGYQVRLNSNAWLSPNTSTTTHVFSNLSPGIYNVSVRDSYGCETLNQSVTINRKLTASIETTKISSCASGLIEVTAQGGYANFYYAYMPQGVVPTTSDITTSSVYTVTTQGNYDVYVYDEDITSATYYCVYSETVTIDTADTVSFTLTTTDPLCYGENGSIALEITDGEGLFGITLTNVTAGTTVQTISNFASLTRIFTGLATATYEMAVTDRYGCTVTQTVVINDAPDLGTAEVADIVPTGCEEYDDSVGGNSDQFGIQFINLPTALTGQEIQVSIDGGITWTTTTTFVNIPPATTLYPMIRTVRTSDGQQLCIENLGPYRTHFPFAGFDIALVTTAPACADGIDVTVIVPGATLTDQFSFAINTYTTTAWITTPVGVASYTFTNLTPGRDYTFYVRDENTGCIREENLTFDSYSPTTTISAEVTPACYGSSTGSIEFTVTNNDASHTPAANIIWELYEVDVVSNTGTETFVQSGTTTYGGNATINIIGVDSEKTYYLRVTEDTVTIADRCVFGSANVYMPQMTEITYDLAVTQDIGCDIPGIIQVTNVSGSAGGGYIFEYSGSNINGTHSSTSAVIEIPKTVLIDDTVTSVDVDIRIYDEYGCEVTTSTVVDVSALPSVTATVQNCTEPFAIMATPGSGAATDYYYSINGTDFRDNGGQFTNNITAGTYTVTIKDKTTGCTAIDVVTVYEVFEPSADVTTLLGCTNDGIIAITVSGGSGDYQYSASGPSTIVPATNFMGGTATFTVSAYGTFNILVLDNQLSSCGVKTLTVTVDEPVTPEFTLTSSPMSCNGANDAVIYIHETDTGVGPYTYAILPVVGTYSTTIKAYENVTPGTFIVTSTAANGCTYTQSITIDNVDPIVVPASTVSVTQFACDATTNSVNRAEVVVNTSGITGGSGTYTNFEFTFTPNDGSGVVTQTSALNTFVTTNTSGGDVAIVVTDSNGCTNPVVVTVTIDEIDVLQNLSVNVTQTITCSAGENIQLVATTSTGNVTNLEYSDDGTTWTSTNTFTNLPIGNYVFYVRNTVTECQLAVTHTVSNPNNLVVNPILINSAACVGSNGSATFEVIDTVSGYTGGYTWAIEGTTVNGTVSTGSTTTNPISLPAGTYTFTATETNSPYCEVSYVFSILEPTTTLTATTQVSPITCASTTNGSIEIINQAGGWGNYTYYVGTTAPTLTDYQASPLFTGLGVGTYQVYIKDGRNCELRLDDVTLTLPIPITATLSVTTQNCVAGSGEIEVLNTQGGQGTNYTYQLIRNGVNYGASQTTATFTNLPSGTYQVRITDGWTCSATITTSVELYAPLTVVPTIVITKQITCSTPTGAEIQIVHSGGSANLRYTVTSVGGSYNNSQVNNNVFTGLTDAGTYSVTIYDITTGCNTVTTTFNLEDVIPVTFTLAKEDVSCNGGTNGSIAVTIPATNTQTPYVVVLDSDVTGFVAQTQTATAYPSTRYFTNLSAGNYTVTITSGRGCVSETTVEITEPEDLTISSTLTSATDFACDATNISQPSILTVVAEGGTAPYQFSIDGVNFNNNTGVFTITDTGMTQTITVYVKDANGCSVDNVTTPIVIEPLPRINSVTVSQTTAITCVNDEEIDLTIVGGAGNGYTIDVVTTASTTVATQNLPAGVYSTSFTLDTPGQYDFTITDDETGCYTSVTYVVENYNTIKATATMSSTVSCSDSSDGVITLAVTGYVGNYNYEVLYTDGTSLATPITGSGIATGSSTTTISGVPAGEWIVRVTATDTPYCNTDSGVVYVTRPTSALTITATLVNNLTCDGNDAEIAVIANGGWGDYVYALYDGTTPHAVYGTYTTTTNFVNLDVGSYIVWVRDAGGCVASATTSIDVVIPTAITADIIATGTIACTGDETVAVEATNVIGGSGTYQYTLITQTASGTVESAAQTSPIFNNLGAGTYAIKVIDGWNCDATTASVTITEPEEIEVTAVITTNITCLNAQATVTLSATGGTGTGTYSYSTSQAGPFLPTNTFSVGVGSHTFYATDANGCISDVSNTIVINPIPDLGLNIDTTNAYVTCNGESSATIVAEAYGGLGNYQYELLDGTGGSLATPTVNTDGVFSNIPAGNYMIVVTSDDCTYTTTTVITVNEAPALVVDTATSTNVTCNGENDGTIEVLVSGGTGSITYAISPRLDRFESINRFENLEPNDYTVIAQDKNGCFIEFDFTITEPQALVVSEVSVTSETCYGYSDGTATITVSGGTAPYYTALDDNTASATWTLNKFYYDNLPAAVNVIFVRDANNCESYVVLSEVEAGVDLQATYSVTYGCDINTIENTLTVNVNPLYASEVTYSLDGGTPTTNNVFNVSGGIHTVTISHTGGCVLELPVTVENYEPLEIISSNISDVSCSGAQDGIITVEVRGGLGRYQYAISPNLTHFDTANQFRGLSGGTYTVVVQDLVLGCTISETYTVYEPEALEINVISQTNETCYAQNDGSIAFEIMGSRPNYHYDLINSNGVTRYTGANIIVGSAINLPDLAPDTYELHYGDSGSCSNTLTFTIEAAPNLLPTSVDLEYICATASNTSVTNQLIVRFDSTELTITNTTYALNSTSQASAVAFDVFNGNTAIINNLPAGSGQYITIFHNGCQTTISTSQYFDVENYNPLTLTDISDTSIINQIEVLAQGGAAPYTYYFNGVNYGTNGEYIVKRTDPGYTNVNGNMIKVITATVIDGIGCEYEIVIEREFIDIKIPDHFTPDGDGNNDNWSPENTVSYPNMETRIYDRYGRLVATLARGQSWNGLYNSKELPSGDYWYIIRLNEDADDSREYVGHFTLYR